VAAILELFGERRNMHNCMEKLELRRVKMELQRENKCSSRRGLQPLPERACSTILSW
jgi:hypothetical protein